MALFNSLFNRTRNKILDNDTVLGPCEFISDGTVDEYQMSINETSKWHKIYNKWKL